MKSRILKVTLNSKAILVLIGFSTTVCLFAVSTNARYIIAPIAATLFTALLFWLTLTHRRRENPISDPGTLTVLAIVCYTIIPPLQFLLSGMEFTTQSSHQLYILSPTPEELGAFTWWYVVYLLCFVIGYLVTDCKNKILCSKPRPPNYGTIRSLLILFIILSAIMFAIEALYGINMYGVYDVEQMYDSYENYLGMPILFKQFYGIIGHTGVFFIVKLGLLLTIFLNWRKRTYRYAFYAWLLFCIVSNVIWMGARTELVLIILASAIMYHQFVKPLRLKQILLVGIILFAGFMAIGMMRGGRNLAANLEKIENGQNAKAFNLSTNNEFLALFGGNYDLLLMKKEGLLDEIPLQFMLFDLVMIIPQQILPFQKLDIQRWIGERSPNPSFFMFNPISQSIIGFGWVELILRGLFLGFVFAKMRAWYIRRATSFWVTLFYFYMVIISYYTIRGTAIYVLLVSILFRFIPLYLLVRLMANRRRCVPEPISSRIVGV